jgi:ABC-type molybdenum transport system ATPase subunit/photorepair protein PhrA
VDEAVPRTGASLIFVTHHPREMPRCVTHLLELRNGRIVRQGPRRR